MNDILPSQRLAARPQALHFSYEKAGLVVPDQPIPWNAEAVLVEALVKAAGRSLADFQLRLNDQPPIPAETSRQDETEQSHHLFFRLRPPTQPTTAELLWRTTSLGQVELPVLSREQFLAGLRVQMPALFVRIGEQFVACQTFVATQCRGLMASALITSPTSLVPLRELELQVEFLPEQGEAGFTAAAPLTSSQLAGRQALVSLMPEKFPRRLGDWTITWQVGGRPLLTQRFRAISQAVFQKSLRICDTRFVVQSAREGLRLFRQLPPMEKDDRAGPCFLVASGEAGMAGLCTVEVRAQSSKGGSVPELAEQEVLITDGPTLVAPGTVDGKELAEVHGFELRIKKAVLGSISLEGSPSAQFSAEGGFKPVTDFTWNAAAEDELSKRLGRLTENW